MAARSDTFCGLVIFPSLTSDTDVGFTYTVKNLQVASMTFEALKAVNLSMTAANLIPRVLAAMLLDIEKSGIMKRWIMGSRRPISHSHMESNGRVVITVIYG